MRPTSKMRYGRITKASLQNPFLRLPFVSKESNWTMPIPAEYGPGCEMGEAAAFAFLKALRAKRIERGGELQSIVLEMLESKTDWSAPGARGQIVGFFYALDTLLTSAVKQFGVGLDSVSEANIVHDLNFAYGDTDEALMARAVAGNAAPEQESQHDAL